MWQGFYKGMDFVKLPVKIKAFPWNALPAIVSRHISGNA
jgi:hypothetical protein